MPCWAELEDQFEMDCSRQGANDTQCSAHLLSLLCFLHPSLSLTVISFSPYIFLSYLLLSLSIVSHLSSPVLLCCCLTLCSPFCITSYSCLLFAFSHLLPLAFSYQHQVGSRDRDDFISRANPCRVISLQDRGDNSSGLVIHTATEYMDIH